MKNLKKLSRENLKSLKGAGGPYKPCDDISDVSNCYLSYDHCRLYSGSGCSAIGFCGQTLYCI